MKTLKSNMLSLFWTLGLFIISININSQEGKLSRQEQKEVRKAQLAANFHVLETLLDSKSFVLEADYLQNQLGDRIIVTPNLNFVKVNDSRGILQTGSDFRMGYNGVGGVTAEGTIGGWKIFKDTKRLNFRLQFNLLSNIGIYDVSIFITADNRAWATITGLRSGKLIWEGHLVSIENSRVFKGTNTI